MTQTHDVRGRPYAKLGALKPGDLIVVDDGFDCLLPFTELPVVLVNGELAVIHNTVECGACGGSDGDCPHGLDGQLQCDGDTLIGIYHKADFTPHKDDVPPPAAKVVGELL